jgi:hypothetical protein
MNALSVLGPAAQPWSAAGSTHPWSEVPNVHGRISRHDAASDRPGPEGPGIVGEWAVERQETGAGGEAELKPVV